MDSKKIKKTVRHDYAKIAKGNSGCGCGSEDLCCGQKNTARHISSSLGYSDNQMNSVPQAANLGLGCGNPTALGQIKKGDVVL